MDQPELTDNPHNMKNVLILGAAVASACAANAAWIKAVMAVIECTFTVCVDDAQMKVTIAVNECTVSG